MGRIIESGKRDRNKENIPSQWKLEPKRDDVDKAMEEPHYVGYEWVSKWLKEKEWWNGVQIVSETVMIDADTGGMVKGSEARLCDRSLTRLKEWDYMPG